MARELDRLLVAGVVEARGCERLFLLAEALSAQGSVLSSTYLDLARAESRHHGLFFRLARELFDEREVATRAEQLLDIEDFGEGPSVDRLRAVLPGEA